MRNFGWMTGLTLLAVTSSAFLVGRTQRWQISTAEEYQNGTLENIIVSSNGELSLGPAQTRIPTSEVTFWSSTVDAKTGAIYFGTGNEGKLYTLTAQRELKEIGQTGELVITALSSGADGKLYAATMPAGKIFTFEAAGGKGTLFATLPDPYVWSMTFDSAGNLLAGTGPDGKIYAISTDGKSSVLFETKQSHVLSLAWTPGGLYAGTSPNGVLFRITGPAKGEVVFHTDEQEIRALCWAENTLWIGANKSKKFDPKKFVKRLQAAAAQAQEGEEKESPFQELFDGSVYMLTAKDAPRLIHSIAKSYLTSLAVDRTGAILVGTGDEGRLWRLHRDGTQTLLAKVKESQVMTLALAQGELAAFGTGSTGSVYALTPGAASSGSYTSEIKDAKFPATWGMISWDETAPLRVETRTGRTAKPDEGTWSDWSPALTGKSGRIVSPAGRFFQFRVSWGEGSKASLRWVNVFYKTENQQPQFKELEIESGDEKGPQNGKARESAEASIRWKVDDADGDELLFRVFVQREGSEEWLPLLKEPTAKKDCKWDTAQYADGWYRVRVSASDEPLNPSGTALSAVRVSRPVLVDNGKPAFAAPAVKDGLFTTVVQDASSVIARIEYSIDAGPWQYVLPLDGLYDDRNEQVRLELPPQGTPGLHQITVRAFDTVGNTAVWQDVFRTK